MTVQENIENFNTIVEELTQRLREDEWDVESKPNHIICPLCFASVTVGVKDSHVDWHVDQYRLFQSLFPIFASLEQAASAPRNGFRSGPRVSSGVGDASAGPVADEPSQPS